MLKFNFLIRFYILFITTLVLFFHVSLFQFLYEKLIKIKYFCCEKQIKAQLSFLKPIMKLSKPTNLQQWFAKLEDNFCIQFSLLIITLQFLKEKFWNLLKSSKILWPGLEMALICHCFYFPNKKLIVLISLFL